MGRKRRKKVRTRPRPSLPTIFECPLCEANSVRIEVNKKNKTAEIKCGNSECSLTTEVSIKSYDEPVDIYGKWIDGFAKEKTDYDEEETEKIELIEEDDEDEEKTDRVEPIQDLAALNPKKVTTEEKNRKENDDDDDIDYDDDDYDEDYDKY